MVRKLKIDLNELALAFQEDLPEFSHYLDLETGRVLCVDNQLVGEDAEDYSEPIEDLDEDLGTLGGHFHGKEPDWIETARMEAEEIEAGLGTRYIEVAHDDPREAYRDMEAFIATVEDKRLQNRLGKAIELVYVQVPVFRSKISAVFVGGSLPPAIRIFDELYRTDDP